MHCTAPSPIVYPVDPVCGQRHCNEGDKPQRSVSKLTSRKDSKHDTAHDGMNAARSDPSSNPPVEDAAVVSVALTARSGIVVAHSSSLVLLAAILGNNIYLPVGDRVRMLVEEARKSKHGTAERQVSPSPRHRHRPGDQAVVRPGNRGKFGNRSTSKRGRGRDLKYPPTTRDGGAMGDLATRDKGDGGCLTNLLRRRPVLRRWPASQHCLEAFFRRRQHKEI